MAFCQTLWVKHKWLRDSSCSSCTTIRYPETHRIRSCDPCGPTLPQEGSKSRKEVINFAWQGFARLQRGSDIEGKSWRMHGISSDRGCGQGTCDRARAYCSQTSVNWLGRASARNRGGFELIVSPAATSLSLCLLSEMKEAFSFLSFLFSSLGHCGTLFYFPWWVDCSR